MSQANSAHTRRVAVPLRRSGEIATFGPGGNGTDRMNTSASWTRIEAALDEILALPTAEWSAAAIRLAAGDANLLREIQTLLQYAGDEASLLDRPLEFHANLEPANLEPVRAVLNAGARIGAYRILELVGRGGMASVYKARDRYRASLGVADCFVALKIVQPHPFADIVRHRLNPSHAPRQ